MSRTISAALIGVLVLVLAVSPRAAGEDKPPVPKFTAVDLTTKFKNDKGDKALKELFGKPVEVEGEVRTSQRSAGGDQWVLDLRGCKTEGDREATVGMVFAADNPDLPKARKLAEGDRVTVRAGFGFSFGATVTLKEPRLLKAPAGDKPAARKPDVAASAEEFVKGALADPKASEGKLKGKVVELTGAVSTADPTYSRWGITLAAGKIKPADMFGVFAECAVSDDDLERVWLLAPGQKVKVTGEVATVQADRVRLARCEVAELEPNPMPTVASTDLAAAYAKDEKAAVKQFGDRYNLKDVFLEGTVKEKTPGKYGTTLTLEGAGKVGVKVQVDAKEADSLKAGDAVRLKARCRGYWPEEKGVLLQGRVLKGDK